MVLIYGVGVLMYIVGMVGMHGVGDGVDVWWWVVLIYDVEVLMHIGGWC